MQRRLWIVLASSLLLGGLWSGTAVAQADEETWGNPCTDVQNATGRRFNQSQGETVIVLGRLPEHRYVVIVPGEEQEALTAVRQCVDDAFMTDSRLGPYIQAGVFLSRGPAEQLSRYLRSRGLDARVVYFR